MVFAASRTSESGATGAPELLCIVAANEPGGRVRAHVINGNWGLGVVSSVTWRPASCADWTAGTAAAATGQLSYSASSGRYLDAVPTAKSWKGSCRLLALELADGTQHTVRVTFTH